jgi:hypothetical protein
MTDIDYFELPNSGQTLDLATFKDQNRLYASGVVYELETIPLCPTFEFSGPWKSLWGQFTMFMANDRIDYEVLTSLN